MIAHNRFMAVMHRAKRLSLQFRLHADALQADVRGQDLVEYALMAGFVAVAAGALMPGAAANISKIFSSISSAMSNAKNTGS